MTKARTNASASPAVGRNMIINGAMNVAQRSASVTGIGATSGTYPTLDRYAIGLGAGAGRLTMTQTADGPNGISANCLKLDCTTADTSIAAGEFLGIWHAMEGQNIQRIGKGVAGAQQVTVSFYVKANAAATYVLELEDADNARTNGKLFSVTTDWVRHEIVFEADVDDGSSPFDDDNAGSLVIAWYLHGGSNFTSGTLASGWANTTAANRLVGIDSFFDATTRTFFLTGVQMEVGPVATEFEQEDISTTLAKCQRYYYQLTSEGVATNYILGSVESATTAAMGGLAFPSEMRAIPAAALLGTNITKFYSAATGTDVSVAISTNRCSKSIGAFIIDSFTGATVGQSSSLYNGGSGSGISFDAEL